MNLQVVWVRPHSLNAAPSGTVTSPCKCRVRQEQCAMYNDEQEVNGNEEKKLPQNEA